MGAAHRVYALMLAAALVCPACDGASPAGGDDGPSVRSPDQGADAYRPIVPQPGAGCPAPGLAIDCGQVCASRLATCSDGASDVCPDAWLRLPALTGACEQLCQDYPTFARRACEASTCDAFVGALVDLEPDTGRACGREGAERDVVDACTSLNTCVDGCYDGDWQDAPACAAACTDRVEAVPAVVDAAAQRLSALRECRGQCIAEGCGLAECDAFRCRCAHDACFGRGVPTAMAEMCREQPSIPVGQGCVGRVTEGEAGRTCGALVECLCGCADDRNCSRRCVYEASTGGFASYVEAKRCHDARACDDPLDCPDEEGGAGSGFVCPYLFEPGADGCAAQWAACRADRVTYGAGGCNTLLDCARNCGSGREGAYCRYACRLAASPEANAALDAIVRCRQGAGCELDATCPLCARETEACQGR